MTAQGKWKILLALVALWVSILGLREIIHVPSPTPTSRGRIVNEEGQSKLGSGNLPTGTPINEQFQTPKNIFLPLPMTIMTHARHFVNRKPASLTPMSANFPTPAIIQPLPIPSPALSQPNQAALEQIRRQRQQAEQQGRQELSQFRFLGFVSTSGGKQAFLTRGSVMHLVESGDTVDGHIDVVMIDAESMALRHAIGNVESTLLLSKTAEASR